jgi:hypothetical protein
MAADQIMKDGKTMRLSYSINASSGSGQMVVVPLHGDHNIFKITLGGKRG